MIKVVQLPTPYYNYRITRFNHCNSIIPCGYVKSMLSEKFDERNISIIPQREVDLGGDEFLINRLLEENTKVVIFPALVDFNFERSKFIAQQLKIRNPEIKIIISGSHVVEQNMDNLNDFPFDCGQTLLFTPSVLTNCLLNNDSSIPFFTAGGKKIFHEKNFNEYCNIKNVKSPYLKGFMESAFIYKFTAIETRRGCFDKCAFCFLGNFDNTHVSSRSILDIKRELILFLEKGINSVQWLDFTFNYPRDHCEEICRLISRVDSSRQIESLAYIRPEFVDLAQIKLLKKANIKSLDIGLQTAAVDTLKKLDRYAFLDKWLRGVKLLKKSGFHLDIDIILGLPGDNLNLYKKTINFLAEEDLIYATGGYLLRVDPSTPLAAILKGENAEYTKNAPHLIFSSNGFTFSELKEAISYTQQMGAKIVSEPLKNDTPPFFTTFFKNGNIENTQAKESFPITKIIFNVNSGLFVYPKLKEIVQNFKCQISYAPTVWFRGRGLLAETEEIMDVIRALSRANPYNVWNIIFEDEEIIEPDFVRKVDGNIFYYPNNLDYESIYLAQSYEKEYLRTSTRFYFLIKNPEKYKKKLLNELRDLGHLYLEIVFNGSLKHLDCDFEGFVFDFKDNISRADILHIFGDIYRQNWKKRNILFKNLYYQTLYDHNFRNVYEPEGYEENIIEIKDNNIVNRIFGENLLGSEFSQMKRNLNY